MAARGLNQSGRTGDWMVRAGLMEKIMSKTTTHNSESREVRELTERELKDHELELVSGGYVKQFEDSCDRVKASIATSEVFELNS